MRYAIGVDIGGTKIASGIIDEKANNLYRVEVPSDPSNRDTMFNQVVECIEKVLQESGMNISELTGMGIGVPGKIDSENGIAVYQNNIPWCNFPVVQRIREHFLLDKIVIDNDVYMATYAEWKMGDQKGIFVYITISTGLSCSIIHDGTFIRGSGFAGELGLLPVKVNGDLKRLEQVASGTAIAQADGKHSTKEVIKKYGQHDPDAKLIISNMAESIAQGIYSLCCILDPNKIVIGGGVVNHHPYLLNLVKEKLAAYLISEQKEVLQRMHVSQLKGDSGIIGAALRVF